MEVQIMTKQRKSARSDNRKRQFSMRAAKRGAKAAKPRQVPAQAMSPARPSKKGSILGLLQRPQGAAIKELTEATGWQSHSVRAALTGFRKEGRELVRSKDEAGTTRYSLSARA
jgi:Protein of unknown function (DUF3489)